jgi:hypothetical protein
MHAFLKVNNCLKLTITIDTHYPICVAVMAHHTPILIVKGNFKSLPQINTAPVPTVLISIYPLRWNKALSVKNVCLHQEHGQVLPAKTGHKNAFFNYLNLLFYIALVSTPS